MRIFFLIICMHSSMFLDAKEIMCELKGTYETTYGVPNRNYLKDFGDALKTFTAGPYTCLLYTSPSPRDRTRSRMPSSA